MMASALNAAPDRAQGWPVFAGGGCCISDAWTVHGLRAVVLENDWLRVVALPGKGGEIVEFRYKPYDLNFLLTLPGGVRSPRGLDVLSETAFLDAYSGGWNEVLPNGGPPITYQGAPLGQHGEVSLARWQHAILEDTPDRVRVRLWVRGIRTPFRLEKTLTLHADRAALFVEERLTNEGGQPLHAMWGQHIAFGNPFLRDGARIFAPAGRLIAHDAIPGYEPRRFAPGSESAWPSATSPDGLTVDSSLVPPYGEVGAQEMAYLTDLRDGWYAILNPAHRVGFGLRFDAALYPYLWLWQQLGEVATGYPWWGRLHIVALEPWTSYPTNGLPAAIENGSALRLEAGEQIETRLAAVAFSGVAEVTAVTDAGAVEGS